MKHLILKTTTLLLILILFNSCQKKEEIIDELSNNDAVIIIENSLKSESGGLTYQAEEITRTWQENLSENLQCNETYQNSFPVYSQGQNYQINYNFIWNFRLNCNNLNLPESFIFTAESAGNFSSDRINLSDNSTSNLSVQNLQLAADKLIINGEYTRQGVQYLNLHNDRIINSKFNTTVNDLYIDKETYRITSGTATFTLAGNTQNTDFDISGNIIFLGNEEASITINDNTYTINLN